MIVALQTLIFFRESLLAVLDRWLPPLFSQLFMKFSRSGLMIEDDGSEDQVFSDFDDERGVMFVPPVHAQRYAAVCDCLMDERWSGKLEKVVNMGKHHDMVFIKYLTEVPGIAEILGVDIECSLHCSSEMLDFTFENYRRKRDKSLTVTLLRGNAADPDYRLIGCDAVIAIEMIEYMLPHDLDRLVHNLFGFVKPWIAVFTTPNADFNVLFKSLEKNGMRRLDHYFEWTRAQLHDWCSNIVARYPAYTVSCRGVGPGPPGTSHYGCCSQLVLFVSKNYQKQMALNVNSLALVNNFPQPNQINDFIAGWDSPCSEAVTRNTICAPDEEEYSMLRYPTAYNSCHSAITVSFESHTQFKDKATQCNLELEIGKSFVMFDVEELYEVVMPRRRQYSRVYEMEDVVSRLNNTMFEVKKFSKTTQYLMAKNRLDCLTHTREVMDEISHLTKMLNFNCLTRGEQNYTWCNINWGENAPYWNQYYEVMAVYNYPYEERDQDSVILDLVTDEINRRLDYEYDDASAHVDKVEIPVEALMDAVKHITDDVDRVVDLMEYNGYEVDGGVVVHSRIVDDGSVRSRDDDWLDETYSDWNTSDVNSISMSDGSNAALDVNARCLRRALDRQVKKLRTMFTRDEDIAKELNHVVCRLVKMALSSSRGRQITVPSKWLQCKLLDLLTLAEKAIVRRKIKFIEDYPLKALGYESQDEVASEMTELCRIKEDDTATRIVARYRHLVQASDVRFDSEYENEDSEPEDDYSNFSAGYTKSLDPIDERKSTEFENIDLCVLRGTTLHDNVNCNLPERDQSPVMKYDDRNINRTQRWMNDDQILPPYSNGINKSTIMYGDDHSSSKGRSKRMKLRKKHTSKLLNRKVMKSKASASLAFPLSAIHMKKTDNRSDNSRDISFKVRSTKINTSKKYMKAKNSYNNLIKKINHKATSSDTKETNVHIFKCDDLIKPNENLYPFPIVQITVPRPEQSFTLDGVSKVEQSVAATENSMLIQIVTEDELETVALRRSVGTDAEFDPEMYEQELELTNQARIFSEETSKTCYDLPTNTAQNSHTIFLYDINEPSTSKGVCHVSMDVQCGPDATATNYAMLSATTSLTVLPKTLVTGIKISGSFPEVGADNTSDFGTSTNDTNKYCMSPKMKSVGIKIKDSEPRITNLLADVIVDEESDLNGCNIVPNEKRLVSSPAQSTDKPINDVNTENNMVRDCFATVQNITVEEPNAENMTVTETLKRVSSHLKIDSCSEFNSSFGSLLKTPITVRFAQEGNNLKSATPRISMSKDVLNLSCGGVHVHSYKDRQVSEDVVYQGEWQQYRPVPRKKPYNATASRKNKESVVKKTSAAPKRDYQVKQKKETISGSAKVPPKQVRYNRMTQMKDEMTNKLLRKKSPSAVTIVKPILKPWKNSSKVSSSLGTGNVPQKRKSKTTVQIVRRTKSVPPVLKKQSKESVKTSRKCYIPPYLLKMAQKGEGQRLLKSNPKQNMIKTNQKKKIPTLETQAKKMKSDLLKVYEPRENISYVVFRNEIDNAKSGTEVGETSVSVRPTDLSNARQRALSPASRNSSSCSSPNSIATVRAVPTRQKRHSTPNTKSNVSDSTSDNKMPVRNRKFKKILISKRKSDQDVGNKENVPESSRNLKLITTDTERALSGVLKGTKENIYTGKMLCDNMQASNKSTIKMPFVKIIDSKNITGSSDENNEFCSPQDSNMVVLIEPGQPDGITRELLDTPCSQESFRIVDSEVLSEWIASPNRKVVENHTSNILAAMKQLVEESLDFIDTSDDNFLNVDTRTVVLTHEGSTDTDLEELSMSQTLSFKTVINNDSVTFHSVNDSGAAQSVLSLADADLFSFKSAPSASKLSDCFADSESNSCAVREIYERKETILTQTPGASAIQAFSGYSMNAELVAGDQPDYVNLIDSETGSGAYGTTRQAISEQLIISGRSSESFASCLLDEDAEVPSWLFQIISRQQSANLSRSAEPRLVAEPELPLPYEADLDENSNETALTAGAGAGDGRGIHSDRSQDSSGQGSSLSSSATSSEEQSEAIVIDPTAFIAQYELLREANAMAAAADLSNSSARTAAFDPQSTNDPPGDRQARLHAPPTASDVDADISSTDTDVMSDD